MQQQINTVYNPSLFLPQQPMASISMSDRGLSESDTLTEVHDYVNAVVLNKAGEALILEGSPDGRGWASWHMIGRSIQLGEDPILAVQQDLLERTGYKSNQWLFLGAYTIGHNQIDRNEIDRDQPTGAGYFFCAHNIHPATPLVSPHENLRLKWVTKKELKQALLDGRIAVINHAIAAYMALTLCDLAEY
jgi:hypothetical protein